MLTGHVKNALEIILTHENTDFDAAASLLAAHKLHPGSMPVLPDRLNQNVARFITLYQNALPYVRQADVQIADVQKVILVDSQRSVKLPGLPAETPIHIIDHHPMNADLQPHQTFTGEPVGAATTLLVEQIQQQGLVVNPLEATLLMLGIYEDTGSLSYGTTTPRDHRAAAWLLEHQATLDTVRKFLSHPLNDDQRALFEKLAASAESRTIEGYIVTICTAQIDQHVSEISSVAHRLRDTLDSAVLFVVVQMPEYLQLICRATIDGFNVGDVARLFGGGGHERAAAASIHEKTLAETVSQLWTAVSQRIQPATRVADLMSHGAQTIQADTPIKDVVRKLRRIGHEGFPVTENGNVVGLLTIREINRAAEHGLEQLTVRDIMTAGTVTLNPGDSVWTLEQRMVESGWGQIPVLDDQDKLIGIVTRTDLIKHWARIHPAQQVEIPSLKPRQIETVLGKNIHDLIQLVAKQAQQAELTLYMVGGVIRDLLLDRQNFDLDFVVEDDAIRFAESLQKQFGGQVNSFRPFGTAKWSLDPGMAKVLNISFDGLPEHIDFATARNEFYEHPTALPTVYNSSIKLDLGRRDFTINTLAVQLSPATASGRILDFYGGLDDLKAKRIRVLHSLSYVDDPTRILRAMRFEHRLGFSIEARTAELIETAKPMLARITGERLRNELTLLLHEKEPERALLNLQKRGILAAIYPKFGIPVDIIDRFQHARQSDPPWECDPIDIADLYWHIIGVNLSQTDLQGLRERLLIPHGTAESMSDARKIVGNAEHLARLSLQPSAVVDELKNIPEMALLTAWLSIRQESVQNSIRRYWVEWQHVQPATNGHSLREMGLTPGPCFSMILKRLKDAYLDNEIHNEAEEKQLLEKLIRDGICDERR
jgi:tRNA nucleotidyltransferase (CCA-adding enzyme)